MGYPRDEGIPQRILRWWLKFHLNNLLTYHNNQWHMSLRTVPGGPNGTPESNTLRSRRDGIVKVHILVFFKSCRANLNSGFLVWKQIEWPIFSAIGCPVCRLKIMSLPKHFISLKANVQFSARLGVQTIPSFQCMIA